MRVWGNILLHEGIEGYGEMGEHPHAWGIVILEKTISSFVLIAISIAA